MPFLDGLRLFGGYQTVNDIFKTTKASDGIFMVGLRYDLPL
jgi:hypothetical protein